MRYTVEKDDPAIGVASLAFAGAGDVDDVMLAQAAGVGDGQGAVAGLDGEDPSRRTRGVFETRKGYEENRAEGDPAEVKRPPALGKMHVRIILSLRNVHLVHAVHNVHFPLSCAA